MDDKLFHEQWLGAYVMSPILHWDWSKDAEQDEWAMWNNGGEMFSPAMNYSAVIQGGEL